MSSQSIYPMGPGWFILFHNGIGGPREEKKRYIDRMKRDDDDILEILTMLATTNVLR